MLFESKKVLVLKVQLLERKVWRAGQQSVFADLINETVNLYKEENPEVGLFTEESEWWKCSRRQLKRMIKYLESVLELYSYINSEDEPKQETESD